jgi:hypothetical protein
MKAGRRARRALERRRLAERESKRHGAPFFAEQRRLITNREDARQRRDGRRDRADLTAGSGFVPASENQIRKIRGYACAAMPWRSDAAPSIARCIAGSPFMIVDCFCSVEEIAPMDVDPHSGLW